MELSDYYALVRPLPLPTEEQVERFCRHVVSAHSWYKHLPLEGAEFVVFSDPNAGGAFDEKQPRLHHTWRTAAEYRESFGHLSYMWRHARGGSFSTDYELNARIAIKPDGTGRFVDERKTTILELPIEIMRDAGFTLFPFACDNYVFFDRFEDSLRRIAAGELEHPCWGLLADYYLAEAAHRRAYLAFHNQVAHGFAAGIPHRGTLLPIHAERPVDEWSYFRAEEEAVAAIYREPARRAELNPTELDYFSSRRAAWIADSRLAKHERETVSAALRGLGHHLRRARLEHH